MHLLSVFSLRNRALIALVTVVIAVFGTISLTSLRQELIPSLNFPQLVVVTSYPGAAPEVVDQYVSAPIETAIQAVEGLESTTSTSSTNRSSVSASFDYGTDLVSAEQKVERAINRIKDVLPSGVDPRVITGSIDDLPVIQVAVTSDLGAQDLTAALQGATLTEIQSLDGVRQASLLGTTAQRVAITPDQAKLAAAGAGPRAIQDALSANGALLPAGSITENGKTLSVQAGSRLGSVEDIAALPLAAANLGGGDTDDRGCRRGRHRRRPGHGHLPGQRRTIAHHRRHENPGRQHRRRVEGGARAAAGAGVSARRQRAAHRRLRSGPVHPAVDRLAGHRGTARPGLRRHRHPDLPDVDPLDARHRDLDPGVGAHHLHRHAGGRLHAQHHHARRAHDRDRAGGG